MRSRLVTKPSSRRADWDLMEKQLQIDLKQIDYASSNIRLALLQEDFYE